MDEVRKILKACSSCKYAQQRGEKDFFCTQLKGEVYWCATCPLHQPQKENTLVYNEGAIVEVTKEFTFDSCHQLKEYNGACARLHGHTYKLQVTVQGVLDDIGMVIDFKNLKAMVNDLIIKDLDHYNLNDRLIFNTTAENMVVYFYELLERVIIEMSKEEKRYLALTKVKLWETPTSFATYTGRNVPLC